MFSDRSNESYCAVISWAAVVMQDMEILIIKSVTETPSVKPFKRKLLSSAVLYLGKASVLAEIWLNCTQTWFTRNNMITPE